MSAFNQGDPEEYLAAFHAGALSIRQRRIVNNAVVNSALEGHMLSMAATGDLLIEFVAGRISGDTYQQRVLARAGLAPDALAPQPGSSP